MKTNYNEKLIFEKINKIGSCGGDGIVQSLSVGGEARETEEKSIVNFIDPLEIGGDCL